MLYSCSPSAHKAEAGALMVHCQHLLYSETMSQKSN